MPRNRQLAKSTYDSGTKNKTTFYSMSPPGTKKLLVLTQLPGNLQLANLIICHVPRILKSF